MRIKPLHHHNHTPPHPPHPPSAILVIMASCCVLFVAVLCSFLCSAQACPTVSCSNVAPPCRCIGSICRYCPSGGDIDLIEGTVFHCVQPQVCPPIVTPPPVPESTLQPPIVSQLTWAPRDDPHGEGKRVLNIGIDNFEPNPNTLGVCRIRVPNDECHTGANLVVGKYVFGADKCIITEGQCRPEVMFEFEEFETLRESNCYNYWSGVTWTNCNITWAESLNNHTFHRDLFVPVGWDLYTGASIGLCRAHVTIPCGSGNTFSNLLIGKYVVNYGRGECQVTSCGQVLTPAKFDMLSYVATPTPAPTAEPTNAPDPDSSSSSTISQTIGITVGVLGGFFGLIGLFVICRVCRKKSPESSASDYTLMGTTVETTN